MQKAEAGATAVIESSRAQAEVQAQIFMARQFPRDQVKATDRILQACQRPTLAEHALYSYPRGGQQIEGPSIRLAEAIIREWGNCKYGITEVERRGDESSMLAFAWDLETNVFASLDFKVRHYRDSKAKGKQRVEDERDIYEIAANYGSRRLRACILRLVPGDVVDAAVRQCNETLKARIGNLEEKIPAMVKKFEEIGVSKVMLEKRLRHRIETTNAAEILALGKIWNSINDRMSTVSDYFEPEPSGVDSSAGKSSVQAAKDAVTAKAAAAKGSAPAQGTLVGSDEDGVLS